MKPNAKRSALCGMGLLVALLVTMGGVAAGGGAMFDWNGKRYYEIAFSPGDLVEGSTGVWIKGPGLGKPEDGPFFAYLVSSKRRVPFPPPVPDDTMLLGQVIIDEQPDGASHSVAHFSFTVPDLPPGEYHVLHCNDPCTTALGDIMTTPFTIAADDADARAIVAIDRLERTTRSNRFFIKQLRRQVRDLERARSRIADLEQREEALEARVAAIEAELTRTSARSTEATPALGVAALVGLTGVGIAGYRIRRRSYPDRH